MDRTDIIPARTRAERREHGPVSAPLYTLGTIALLVVMGTVLVLTGNAETGTGKRMVDLAIVNLPGLLAAIGAAFFAERASRDVRNGVVEEKARKGAHKALKETGVTQAVASGQQTTPVLLETLVHLLEQRNTADMRKTPLSSLLHQAEEEAKDRHPR